MPYSGWNCTLVRSKLGGSLTPISARTVRVWRLFKDQNPEYFPSFIFLASSARHFCFRYAKTTCGSQFWAETGNCSYRARGDVERTFPASARKDSQALSQGIKVVGLFVDGFSAPDPSIPRVGSLRSVYALEEASR